MTLRSCVHDSLPAVYKESCAANIPPSRYRLALTAFLTVNEPEIFTPGCDLQTGASRLDRRRLNVLRERFEPRAIDRFDAAAIEFHCAGVLQAKERACRHVANGARSRGNLRLRKVLDAGKP